MYHRDLETSAEKKEQYNQALRGMAADRLAKVAAKKKLNKANKKARKEPTTLGTLA